MRIWYKQYWFILILKIKRRRIEKYKNNSINFNSNINNTTRSFAQDNTLAGQNIFDTAIKISNTYKYSEEVILVNFNAIQDVLCATALVLSKNIPIRLTNKSKLNENTLKEIIRLNSDLVYIIGGECVIEKCVEEELDNININFKRISGKYRYNNHNTTQPIVIDNNTWIGLNVTILKGVTIGDDAVIAAGAVVNKDVAPNTLVGGVPTKVIRENVKWK